MPVTAANVPAHVSTVFRQPKHFLNLERAKVTISQVYEWNARENPNYPLFVYQDGEKLEYINYATANRAMDRAGRYILSKLGPEYANPEVQRPTVGILANADTITYFCTTLGLLRAGCLVFVISTRNAGVGIADMAKRTGIKHLLVSEDAKMSKLASDAAQILGDSGIHIGFHAMPIFDDLFSDRLEPNSPFEIPVEFPNKFDMDADCLIMHSSGSTGHPKPIPWSHRRLFDWGQEPARCNVDMSGTIMGCHGTPMFHGLGSFMYSSCPTNGIVLAVFKPASPPTMPTPDAVWQGIVTSDADSTWTVPSFIEEWARDPEKVLVMKKRKGIYFGGAALNEEVGNALAAQGVPLFSAYGLTEVGLVNAFIRPNPGMDWPYWLVNPSLEAAFRPADNNTHEIVILSRPEYPLPVTNTKENGRDAYATSDLVVSHPTKPGLWKIVGRADEQIILSNGEKTNPVPLEKIINQDPRIKCSVMFGRGRFQNGILVEPTEDFTIDPTDLKQLEAFRNKIWPTVERANEYAPQHSRIFKEMILVTSPSKPLQFNVKGLPRRGIILTDYQDEIEALYKEVENSGQSEFPPPAIWDAASTLTFVRTIVESTLQQLIPDDADIFRNGGDSLQATWIRNTILRAISETDREAAKRLPGNLVFKAPTIAALANVVSGVMANSDSAATSHTPDDLWKHVERLSANFPARPANLIQRPAGKDVVLITGTTGGFGCDTLEHLLRDESVGRVYAFNRKGSQAMERQRAQFKARGLDETLLDSPKFRMVEAVLHEPGFGLDAGLLEEVRQSVTHILHNAWRVNFNLSVASFEIDMQGARNFIDLALSSPFVDAPPVVFVSSIGVFQNCKLAAPVPEVPIDDALSPFGSGYTESKWVTERVLQNARERAGLHTVVMRLGQVTGDRLGYWTEKEWFPSLAKSALFQKCLPNIDGLVSWFPAYEAAKAFAEMRHSPEPILHLVHPRPVLWSTLLEPVAKTLGVTLVPYEEWLSALAQSVDEGSAAEVDAMKANPALRLLPFFKAQATAMTPDREPMGLVYLSTEKSSRVSESLARLPQLGADHATSWVAAWKRAGFMN